MKAARQMRTMKLPLLRQTGLSLVEVMIALAIGMFLLLGLSSLLVANSQTSQELNKTGSQIENGRFAIQLLSDDIHLAGFLGTYSPVGATWTIPDPCASALANLGFSNFSNVAAAVTVPVAVYGYVGADTLPTTCTSGGTPVISNRLAGTGVLVIRRVSTTSVAAASAPVAPYLQVSTCPDSLIDTVPLVFATANANFTLRQRDCLSTNLAPAREYKVHIYYVSSCSDCGNDTIPTLKLAEFKNGAFTTSSVVEGIENMQLDYGIDMDGDGAVDCYTSNPTAPPNKEVDPTLFPASACPQTATPYVWSVPTTNWSNVMAVRVNLLARNLEPSTGWVDNKNNRTYDMGLIGTIAATNDAYKRHVYSSVARLYNISGQREK